ncbi:type II toxin-antitoxin system RelE/ParE family toxin [Desulfonatronospira sp. MSAO_Bac3]|uniref:type II toxin-antitoxin system RelE/ParE family toxin n=1 Tax=Desulfonatronospira sp. MSAO_Bac3 TaxID=2293857 RepID=UPI000FF624FE|nr:type II toxin-antitoxin system RelE/ParE family toxin [Desulfonatronospira sp. MSAO_Bac3]RQD78582.1 MAG: type II toxin-antitoxin system RelE/ParE family toxin [Desulfonatronospira sp. MSAO_Bac3]
MPRQKVLVARFYATTSGSMPVREWLLSLNRQDKIEIGSDIANLEFNWPAGPSQCKSLEDGIFEVRSRMTGGRTARVLFFIKEEQMVLLHGFIKKTRKTPRQELDLAKKRKKEMEEI